MSYVKVFPFALNLEELGSEVKRQRPGAGTPGAGSLPVSAANGTGAQSLGLCSPVCLPCTVGRLEGVSLPALRICRGGQVTELMP